MRWDAMGCEAYCMGGGCSAWRRKKGGLGLVATCGLHISVVVLSVVVVVGQSLHGTGATAQYRQNDRASFVSHQKPHAWLLLSLPTYLPV